MSNLIKFPALTNKELLPDEDLLVELGILPAQYGDFYKAVEVVILQRQGSTFEEAVAEVGIKRRTAYGPKWTALFTKAMRLLSAEDMVVIKSVGHRVAQAWPRIVNRLMRIAEHAEADKDAISAAELLYTIFIAQHGEPADTSPQDAYLNSDPEAGFNPMAPMQFIQNNVTINQVQANKPQLPDDDVIEIEAERSS